MPALFPLYRPSPRGRGRDPRLRGRVRGYTVKRLHTKALPCPGGLRKPLTLPPLTAAGPALSLWERGSTARILRIIVTLPIPAPYGVGVGSRKSACFPEGYSDRGLPPPSRRRELSFHLTARRSPVCPGLSRTTLSRRRAAAARRAVLDRPGQTGTLLPPRDEWLALREGALAYDPLLTLVGAALRAEHEVGKCPKLFSRPSIMPLAIVTAGPVEKSSTSSETSTEVLFRLPSHATSYQWLHYRQRTFTPINVWIALCESIDVLLAEAGSPSA